MYQKLWMNSQDEVKSLVGNQAVIVQIIAIIPWVRESQNE